jgi:uncharacterized membrane protein YccC
MLLRNDMELVRAAKALREEIEKMEDEINAIKRVRTILQGQIRKLDKHLNETAQAREGKIRDEQLALAAVESRKEGQKR